MFFLGCHSNKKENNTVKNHFKDFDKKVASIVDEIKPVSVPKDTIDLISYSGHKPDANGSFDYQETINKAIKELSENGGGTLYFRHTLPQDTWVKLTKTYRVKGPIILENNIELLFDHSVRLFFEFDPESYLVDGKGVIRRYEGTTIYSFSPLIYGFNKKNLKIAKAWGHGALPTIEGDGEKWVAWSRQTRTRMNWEDKMSYYDFVRSANKNDMPLRDRKFDDPERHPYRPTMMEFMFCENVEVSGVKLKDALFWVVHPVFSKNLWFHDMIFDCQNVNNDGFDPDSSDNILVENIIFDNHDDNVVAKAGRDFEGRDGVDITGTIIEDIESPYIKNKRLGGPVTDIVFRNSTIQGHYAFAAGSEMSAGVDGVYMYNCVAPIKVKSGVFIKSSRRRGGYVKNVYVKDVDINQSDMAIAIIPNYDGDTIAKFPPKFSNIHLKNIKVNRTESSLRVFGWGDALTEDIFISDITIDKAEQGFLFNYVENLNLKGVVINGENIDGIYSKKSDGELPPEQN